MTNPKDDLLPIRYHFPVTLKREEWRTYQRGRAANACDTLNARLLQIGLGGPSPGSNDPDEDTREFYRLNLEAVIDFMFEAGFPIQATENLKELHHKLMDVTDGAQPSVFRAQTRRSSAGGRSPVPKAIESRRASLAAALHIAQEAGATVEGAARDLARRVRKIEPALFGCVDRVTPKQIRRWRDEFLNESQHSDKGRHFKAILGTAARGYDPKERIERIVHTAIGGRGVDLNSSE